MKKRITFTIEEELIDKLKNLSEKTMIPQAKFIDMAIKDLLEKYEQGKSRD